ncbi:MAG: nitroreductase/quinone reductase family protein [Candidatus Binatus sp.]
MKTDPMTLTFARWFSSMHVAFYRLVDGWSPLNWNTLVLTVHGRKSGREISKPLLYLERDGKLYVVASFGGSDKAPDWYLNLVANPEVTVERRWVRGAYRARTLAPEERQEMWPRLVAMYPAYAEYQKRTSRTIQLVELATV